MKLLQMCDTMCLQYEPDKQGDRCAKQNLTTIAFQFEGAAQGLSVVSCPDCSSALGRSG